MRMHGLQHQLKRQTSLVSNHKKADKTKQNKTNKYATYKHENIKNCAALNSHKQNTRFDRFGVQCSCSVQCYFSFLTVT